MSESPSRIVIGFVVACAVLTLIAIFRSGSSEPEEPAPRPGSFGTAAQKPKAGGSGSFGQRGSDFASAGDASRPRDLPGSGIGGARPGGLTVPDEKVAPPDALVENAEAPAGGARNLAAEPVPAAPLETGGSAGVPESLDAEAAAAFPGLPDGASLAVPFNGNGASLGAAVPLVDENVVYDVDDGAYFPPDARFAYADSGSVQNNAGTIAFWVKPNWTADDPRTASLIQFRTDNWSNRLQIFKNGIYLRYLFTDNTGTETNVSVNMEQPANPPWEPGVWHHIAVTWGDSIITMYADGRIAGQGTYFGALDVPSGTELYVGSDRPGGTSGADATLSRFVVADRVMDGGEVEEMFNTQHP